VGDSSEQLGSDITVERRLECDCFVEGDSERIDVGSLIEEIWITVGLFGLM